MIVKFAAVEKERKERNIGVNIRTIEAMRI
jgi:hypothetical protein